MNDLTNPGNRLHEDILREASSDPIVLIAKYTENAFAFLWHKIRKHYGFVIPDVIFDGVRSIGGLAEKIHSYFQPQEDPGAIKDRFIRYYKEWETRAMEVATRWNESGINGLCGATAVSLQYLLGRGGVDSHIHNPEGHWIVSVPVDGKVISYDPARLLQLYR